MKTKNGEKIGKALRALRGEKTQLEVANALGVTPMAISQYESGARIPNDDMKIKIASYFNKSIEELFFANEVIELIT